MIKVKPIETPGNSACDGVKYVASSGSQDEFMSHGSDLNSR
nr:hypothetical protein [Tanacetum cinerariifolium]